MEGVMAVITCVAYDFAPKNWAYCNGQTLAIAQNQALFSLLGTTFGGNGVTTFQLPNLQGRVPINTGQGPGLSNYNLGQVGGVETNTLTINNLPSHTHSGNVAMRMQSNSDAGDQSRAANGLYAPVTAAYASTANVQMATPTYNLIIGTAGAGQAFSMRPPLLAINYVICTAGIFPSRN